MGLIKFQLYLERKFLDKNMPSALPMREIGAEPGDYTWEDWHKDIKKKKPIRYFLIHSLISWFSLKVISKIDNFIYYLQSHTYRKQHFIDLRQPKTNTQDDYRWGYIDFDRAILFSCFNCLVEYVDLLNSCDWKYGPKDIDKLKQEILTTEDEFHKKHFQESLKHLQDIKVLYNYWKIERKEELKQQDKLLHEWSEERRQFGRDAAEKKFNKLNELEDEFYKKEQEMLSLLLKNRQKMWT